MKINPITYNQQINLKNYQNKENRINAISGMEAIGRFPIGYAKINFRSNRPIRALWDEYNWYINADRTPAIFSFNKMIEEPKILDNFFNEILANAERGKEMLLSIAYHPRQSKEILDKLREILPANSLNLLPFLCSSPYNQAYNEFIDWKYQSAHSLEDLLRIRPDWRGDVLLQKHKELRGNDNLEIGNVPRELPIKHLLKIVDYLRSQMEFGIKSKKTIPSLKIDNRQYDFEFFTEGKSDKNVFGLFTPEGKKFVIKMSKPEARSLDAPFALGTLAKIDSYLTYNRSRNSAPLCYYNHEGNFSIYKFIEHIPADGSTKDLHKIAAKLPDYGALGLTYNDTVGDKNFFMLDTNSNDDIRNAEGFEIGINKDWITVDNDHVTFNNPLQPPVYKYHSTLPNAMQMFF